MGGDVSSLCMMKTILGKKKTKTKKKPMCFDVFALLIKPWEYLQASILDEKYFIVLFCHQTWFACSSVFLALELKTNSC